MENREQQILSEIKSMMASIRSQLERLDAKMAELQQVVDPEEFDMAPIDIDIDEVVHEEPVDGNNTEDNSCNGAYNHQRGIATQWCQHTEQQHRKE